MLEVLGTTNNVLERQRYALDRIRIGRGFGNDLIINDQHTDVEHAVLAVDEEGRLWLEDLDSVNGTRRLKSNQNSQRERVASGDVFLIGRNKLRVYFSDHPLPEAIPIRSFESLLLWLGRPRVLVCLFLVYVGFAYLNFYTTSVSEFEWTAFLGDNAIGALTFVGLAGGVYLLSVLFRRSGNFPAHLSVLLTVAVYSSLSGFLLRVARFNGGDHSYELLAVLDSANGYLVVFMYLWSVLYLAFNMSLRWRSIVASSVVAIALFFSYVANDQFLKDLRSRSFPKERIFLPPALRVVAPIDQEDYLAEVDTLFTEVEELRVEALEERDEE